MNRMLDRLRESQSAISAATKANQHRVKPGIESLEGRSLMALPSLFSGLLPSYISPSSTVQPDKALRQFLQQPEKTSFPPYNIAVGVVASDGVGQAPVVSTSKIHIVGNAPPNAVIWAAYGPLGYFTNITRADASGNFSYDANVPKGATLIRVFSGTLVHTFAANYANDYSNIATVRVVNSNPVIVWDAIAQGAIRNTNISAEVAARDLAILHVAQYDAIAATTRSTVPFLVSPSRIVGASPEAAANEAAAAVLTNLFPDQASTFADALKTAQVVLPKNVAVANGTALGQVVAQETLAARTNDKSMLVTAAGVVQNPNWGEVTPFALTSSAEFRPAAPPAVGTTAFDQALQEVNRLGWLYSTTRTADQTTSALFWADGAGTATNPGHWNEIAEEVAVQRKTNLLAAARTFALLDVAMADAGIAAFDAKAAYNEPRPVTTIGATDPIWTPLVPTPATPSYVSAHAAYGAAAASVLGSVFGSNTAFTTLPNLVNKYPALTFKNFAAAATDDANSRVYGGTNYRFDTTAGATLGTSVGKVALTKFPRQ